MSDKQALELKMEAVLSEWAVKLLESEKRAPFVKPGAKDAYVQYMNTMRAKLLESKTRLNELKAATESNWAPAGQALEKSWSEFVAAFSKSLIQFEGATP